MSVPNVDPKIYTQILGNIIATIAQYNKHNSNKWNIDTIRVTFSKQHKLPKLKSSYKWEKVRSHSKVSKAIKKRLNKKQFTSAMKIENEKIVMYNLQDPPKYRKAEMVFYGLFQYLKDGTVEVGNFELMDDMLSMLKDITSIDVCLDLKQQPNISNLKGRYIPDPQGDEKNGITWYINNAGIPAVDVICIYDKRLKDSLPFPLWRVEARVLIENIKDPFIPLADIEQIVKLLKGA